MSPGDELWAWQAEDPGRPGVWSIVAAFIPALGVTGLLQHRRRDVVTDALFRDMAVKHARELRVGLRLARFELEHVEEVIHPDA